MYADPSAQARPRRAAAMGHVPASCPCWRTGRRCAGRAGSPLGLVCCTHACPPHSARGAGSVGHTAVRLVADAQPPCLAPFPPQGAVLEPQGVVEIKFRTPELIATMHRIDPLILKLKVWAGGRGLAPCARKYGGAGAPSRACMHTWPRQPAHPHAHKGSSRCGNNAALAVTTLTAPDLVHTPSAAVAGPPCRPRAARVRRRRFASASASCCRCTTRWRCSSHRWGLGAAGSGAGVLHVWLAAPAGQAGLAAVDVQSASERPCGPKDALKPGAHAACAQRT